MTYFLNTGKNHIGKFINGRRLLFCVLLFNDKWPLPSVLYAILDSNLIMSFHVTNSITDLFCFPGLMLMLDSTGCFYVMLKYKYWIALRFELSLYSYIRCCCFWYKRNICHRFIIEIPCICILDIERRDSILIK